MDGRFEAMRAAMIDNQLRPTGVNDPRVLAAFAGIAREAFVPPALRRLAYLDEDLEAVPGRFLMEPLVFGNLLMRAEVAPTDRVLLIGAGTGYEAAVIARLAGTVIAVEADAALAASAAAALADAFAFNALVVEAPLTAGAPAHAPFDVLFVNGAVELVPAGLVGQLREDGRMVGVMIDEGGVGRAVQGRRAGDRLATTAFLDAAVAPLPGFARSRAFRF